MLDERPELFPWLLTVFNGYMTLVSSRNINGRIPLSEIVAYYGSYQPDYPLDTFVRMVQAADAAAAEATDKRTKADQARQQQLQKAQQQRPQLVVPRR